MHAAILDMCFACCLHGGTSFDDSSTVIVALDKPSCVQNHPLDSAGLATLLCGSLPAAGFQSIAASANIDRQQPAKFFVALRQMFKPCPSFHHQMVVQCCIFLV